MKVICKPKSNYTVMKDPFQVMDRMFNDHIGTRSRLNLNRPPVNIKEDDDQFQVELSVPGLAKEDLNVEMEKGLMRISAEAEGQDQTKNEQYSKREFWQSSFIREFKIPEHVNAEDVSAECHNGILIVTLPKAEERELRTTQVKVA